MDAATAGFDADGVLEVKHLVVEKVFDGAAGGVGAVEYAAYDDGVVGGVVVAEHAAGVVGGPGESGTAEKSMEETGVEGGEAAEADVEWRVGRAGAEFAVLLLEDGDEGG